MFCLVLKGGPNGLFLQQLKCITAMCPKILLAIKNWMVVGMAGNEASFTRTLTFFGRTFVCGSTALLEVPATV